MMSDLIIGVVMDVVLHFILNNFQGLGIIRIATAARYFVILDAAEFVVLDPKVGLEYLERCWKPKQGCIAWTKTAACFDRARADEEAAPESSCANSE